MRLLRAITVSVGTLALLTTPACGGSDEQPEWPNPTVVDRNSEDMDLPEPEGDTEGEEEGEGEADAEPPAPVQVIAGERSPIEGNAPRIRILAPRNNQVVARGNVSLRLRLSGWDLQPAPGQHVHVIIDDEPYIAVRDVSSPIDLNALVQENLGHELAEGSHVVRVFPSRGHHESVKTSGAFASAVFHYRSRTDGFSFDSGAPLLTYSRPKGCGTAGERLLLDFQVRNVELAEDGHHVRYTIGSVEGDITSWAPHWIENLRPGEHTIRLRLVTNTGELVPGPFNDTTHTIRVAASCD